MSQLEATTCWTSSQPPIPDLVSSVRIVDSCSVSDHKLVIAAINIDPVKPDSIHQTFRDLKNFDAKQFESSLRHSTLFTAPAETAEEFSTQLSEIVSSELNKVCPVEKPRHVALQIRLLGGSHRKPRKQSGTGEGSNELGVALETKLIDSSTGHLVAGRTFSSTTPERNI